MPKALATRNKTVRRSVPLNPTTGSTLKFKSINRTRTSVGRATSKTTKKTEECAHDSPTPLTPTFPSGLPDLNPIEGLDADGQELEQEGLKTQKGPSRAVSVSFLFDAL